MLLQIFERWVRGLEGLSESKKSVEEQNNLVVREADDIKKVV